MHFGTALISNKMLCKTVHKSRGQDKYCRKSHFVTFTFMISFRIFSKHRNPPTKCSTSQILHRSFNQKSGKIKLCSVCPVCNRGCVRPSKFESTPENDVAHVSYVSACLSRCYHLRCCLWLDVYGGDTFYQRT